MLQRTPTITVLCNYFDSILKTKFNTFKISFPDSIKKGFLRKILWPSFGITTWMIFSRWWNSKRWSVLIYGTVWWWGWCWRRTFHFKKYQYFKWRMIRFLLLESLQSFLLNDKLLEFLIVNEIVDELLGLLVPFWLLKKSVITRCRPAMLMYVLISSFFRETEMNLPWKMQKWKIRF